MTDYNVVFPPSGRALFDGGKNSKYERSIIADNESPDCLNVVFSNGAVATRAGSTKLNTAAIGSFVGDGLYTRRANTGAETMIAFAGGSAWQLGGTSFTTIASAQSVFTAGQRVACTQYENHLFIGNGGVTPYKYNGAHFTRHGVPAATGAVSVASQTTGSLNGTYSWKVTYVNSQSVEGDVGTATTFAIVNGTARLSNLPIAPVSHGVNARRIYRYDSGTYKRVAEVSDNTTTTYDDDGTLTLGVAAPTDNGEPPKYGVCITHQNRLFVNDASNPNQVWYSELGEPYTFASTNFDSFGDAAADLVKGFEVYDNSLVVLCENSQWLWYMPDTDDTNWVKVQIRSNFGSKSPFASFRYDNKVAFAAMQNSKFVGFAAISGNSIEPSAALLTVSAAGSDLQTDRIEPDMFQVQEAHVTKISSFVFKNKAYVALTYGDGNTTNNRVYLFDFSLSRLDKKQKNAWVPLTGLNAAQFTVYDGKLYYISSTATGFVYQLETSTYGDDGSAINSYFWTKEFSGNKGHENLEKDFRKVKLLVDKAGAYFMTLGYRVDSDSSDGNTVQINLNPGGSIWNTLIWGQGDWGGGSEQEEISISLGQCRGKRIQFKFSNQNAVNQRFKVHGLNFTYNIKGRR